MRFLPIIPILLSIAALILGFLCLFAGSKPNFLESYSILTLNTSRIGQNVLNSTNSSSSSSNPLTQIFHNLTDPLVADVKGDLNAAVGSLAQELGLEDFYSIHIMDYCHGDFAPQAVPNATVRSIHRNVTGCSNRTGMFAFDARAALERSLNSSGKAGRSAAKLLDEIDWPEDIDRGLRALRAAFKAQFVLYCIALAFTFLVLLASALWAVRGGRLTACSDGLLALTAFFFMGVASAIATAIAVKGSKVINKYGKEVGVSAQRGTAFLGLTWAATACLFVAGLAGCLGIFGARKNKVKRYNGETAVGGEKA